MPQVFISYSRKDIEFVERLVSDLKSAGLSVWYDLSGLDGGTQWGTEIQRALSESQHFLLVLSPNSLESKWVHREFLYAESIDLKVIPLLYLPCVLPMWLLDLQLIDLQGRNYESNFDRVLKALGAKTRAEQLQDQKAAETKARLEAQEKERTALEEKQKQIEDEENKRRLAEQDDRNKARLESDAKERRLQEEQQRQLEVAAKARQQAERQQHNAVKKAATIELWNKWKPLVIRVGGLGILFILVVFIGIQLLSGGFGTSLQPNLTLQPTGTNTSSPSPTLTLQPSFTPEPLHTPLPVSTVESPFITNINDYISQNPPAFEDDFSTPNPAWGYASNGMYIPNFIKDGQLEVVQIGNEVPINGLFKAEDFVLQYDLYPQEKGAYETKIHVAQDKGESSSYYDLIISITGKWNLNYHGNLTGTVLLASGEVNNTRDGSIYQIKILVRDKHMVVFINNNICADIDNLNKPEGTDNFMVFEGNRLFLDNVKFWNLDGVVFNP